MTPLSAIDAVSPAFSRTRLILLSPFRFGRSWKLAATGYLAFSATFFLPIPLMYLSFVFSLRHQGHASLATFFLALITIATAIFLFLFYVCSRLEFVFFDIVLNREQFVAPSWRKFGRQTWPWIAVKVALGAVITAVMARPLMRYFAGFSALTSQMKPGPMAPQDFAVFMRNLLLMEVTILAFFGMLFLVGSLLTDFVLPSLALEDTSLAVAFSRFFRLIAQEPGQLCLYILMKVVLGSAGYVAQVFVYYIVVFIYMIVMAIVFLLGYLILHALHVPSPVMLVMALIIAIPTYFFVAFYTLLLSSGTLFTFIQAYALYFLGGRYPLIGQLLERSTPPVAPAFTYAAPAAPALPIAPPPPSIYSPEAYLHHEPVPPPAPSPQDPQALPPKPE